MIKTFIKILAIIISTLFLLEVGLRLAGYKPGFFLNRESYHKNRFRWVDSLASLPGFYSDSIGVMRINQSVCSDTFSSNPINDIYIQYFCAVRFNSLGFRGRDFCPPPQAGRKKIKVLLLGDSFTYGFSANPISMSFADILDKSGSIEIYNGGIPGSDPATYLAVAKQVCSIIKPNLVIVNFYMQNDEVYYKKKLEPFVFNDIFLTNAGAFVKLNYESLNEDSVEIFATPKDAYNNIFSKTSLLCSDNKIAKIASKLCITTQLFRFLNMEQNVRVSVIKYRKENYTAILLKQIQEEASKINAQFILSFIPQSNVENAAALESEIDSITGNQIPYHLINTLSPRDYVKFPDGHFNNSGHQKYAVFLQNLIDSIYQAEF